MIGIGIVGLPNVGKSTLFNAITKAGAEVANYPFCTINKNVGMVAVPDPRIDELIKIINPKSTVKATIEFVDIAGLVRGASKNEGRGNQFLSDIRHTSAIAQVVRCFEDDNITHVDGSVNPLRDIDTINSELILADLGVVEKAMEKYGKLNKGGNKEAKEMIDLLTKVKAHFEETRLLRNMVLTKEELELLKPYQFLTLKPMVYITNVPEGDMINGNKYVDEVKKYAASHESEVVIISAKVEAELSELPDEDRAAFLSDLGLSEPGLNKVIRAGYKLLDLITYFTAGVQEVRSWPIKAGTVAQKAAGEIHSDIEKGFIRAEVAAYNDFVKYKGWAGSKENGLMRLEGKEYVVKDGDLMYFRFNV